MQQYLFKSLVGFLLAIASCHLASGHSLPFLRSHHEEVARDQQAAVETNIDPANEIEDSPKETKSDKNSFKRKFVAVELEEVGQSVDLKEGDAYELTCNVNASPEPRVYWVRGDNPTKQIEELFKTSVPSELTGVDGSTDSVCRVQSKYVIDCASEQDQGDIHCVAIAGEKTTIQSTVINVKESRFGSSGFCGQTERPPVITYHTSMMFSISGSTVVLPCKAHGSPRPTTHWLNNYGQKISNNHNSRFKVLANGDLLIEEIEWSDMGRITCVAESSVGSASAGTFLYPVKKA